MSIDSLLRFADPPDLLRRFVDTPLQMVVQLGGRRVLIRTNHQGSLNMFSAYAAEDANSDCELTWTLVCDPDLPSELGEPTLVESTPVALLSFGRACFMALCRNQMELMSFISSGVDEQGLREIIFPRVRELIGTANMEKASHA